MKHWFWLSGIFALVMGFVGGLLALLVALPAVADAQGSLMRAERVAAVGLDGRERARLETGPGIASSVDVFGADGTLRTQMVTGGANFGGTDPGGAGVNIFGPEGSRLVRLGTANGSTPGSYAPGANFVLFDSQENPRLALRVAADGTPSIVMLDANGAVTWQAR